MSDLGPLSYFLGIEVLHSEKGYYLSQSKYIQDLIARSGISDHRMAATPMDLHLQLRPTDGTPLADPSRYRHIVGNLVYLTVTRPDIAHAVHILSQFVSSPTTVHYSHLLRVLRYLRGTVAQCLFYGRDGPLQLHAYSDSTWASDPSDRRSITGYCIFLGSSPIAWKSKKQAAVSRSSTEAELRALATTTSEILTLVSLVMPPTPLLCDNTGAIQIANDPVKHELTKHIGVDAFFTRSHCHQKTIDLQYVPSELQLADFFTKAQTREHHRLHLIKLNADNQDRTDDFVIGTRTPDESGITNEFSNTSGGAIIDDTEGHGKAGLGAVTNTGHQQIILRSLQNFSRSNSQDLSRGLSAVAIGSFEVSMQPDTLQTCRAEMILWKSRLKQEEQEMARSYKLCKLAHEDEA
ncbi:hypothetical protein U9M48_034287 [Paspalum notatum var. saurae]|uniref:Reverse transcriptase Ty1/copia-type domain-containing protein n=1 Tax=Paspalum notatum var. saurae TaxID=547442 RepID=A0AAQ3X7T0_PASNO